MHVSETRTQSLTRYHDDVSAVAVYFEKAVEEHKERLEEAAVALGALSSSNPEVISAVLPQLLYMAAGRHADTVAFDPKAGLIGYSSALSGHDTQRILKAPLEQWFFRQVLRSGRTTVSSGIVDDAGSFLYIGSPVFDRSVHRRIRSILVTRINIQKLLDTAVADHLPINATVVLSDHKGQTLGFIGTKSSSSDIFASTEMLSADWTLTMSAPQAELFTRSHVITLFSVIFVILVALFSYLSGREYIRSLSVFFEEMSDYINTLSSSRGPLPEQRELDHVPEARALLVRFRKMAHLLAQSDRALRNANRNLESRVQERTTALSRRNSELSAINSLLGPVSTLEAFGQTDHVAEALHRMKQALEVHSLAITEISDPTPPQAVSIPISTHLNLVAVSSLPDVGMHPNTVESLSRFAGFLRIVLDNQRLYADTRRQHAGLSAVFSAMTEGFALIDEKEKMICHNELFSHLVKVASPTTQSLDFLPQTQDAALSPIAHALSSPTEATQWRIAQPLGREHVYSLYSFSVGLIDAAGNPVRGMALLIRDITHEYEINRLKDDVIGLVSHELNNPISTIGLGIETLLKKSDKIPASLQQGILKNLLGEIHRLQDLVHDWLDVSMLNNGVLTCQKKCINLTALTIAQLENFEQTSKIAVARHIPEAPIFVSADAGRISQVLRNLLDNAVRYNDKQIPEISVKLCLVDKTAQIDVTDNGIGMDQSDIPYLFERFYRSERARQHSPNGSGLGLAICSAIMSAHGGSLTIVDSQPGQGSSFRVCLPICDASLPISENSL